LGITGLEPWFTEKIPFIPTQKSMVVIGAGLAGMSVALEAHGRGWQVTILESGAQLGAGASGNPVACLYPAVASEENTAVGLSELGMRLLRARFIEWGEKFVRGEDYDDAGVIALCGINPGAEKLRARYQKAAQLYPHRYEYLTQKRASQLAKADVSSDGLWLKNGGWLKPLSFLQSASLSISGVSGEKNKLIFGVKCLDLHRLDDQWQVTGKINGEYHRWQASCVVVCGGYQTRDFKQLKWLRTFPVAGQVDMYHPTTSTESIKLPLCYEGYLSPPVAKGLHITGATFRMGSDNKDISYADSLCIRGHITDLLKQPSITQPVMSRCSVRATSPDATPVVGFVVKETEFWRDYGQISKGYAESYLPRAETEVGLYVVTGLGARGALFAPAAAHLLLKQIHGELTDEERSLMARLNGARYLLRQIKKISVK
jgi:tRNA 5-methylaminomethyl-2-thiouridine biosynthesis bifunctional protein